VHAVGGGAQVCLFKAKDDTLTEFTDVGNVFTVNTTYGSFDSNVVWNQTRSVGCSLSDHAFCYCITIEVLTSIVLQAALF
jgi:hypothetical protein